jgi:hypothetical protein
MGCVGRVSDCDGGGTITGLVPVSADVSRAGGGEDTNVSASENELS